MTTKGTRRNFLLASATGVGLMSSVPVLAQDDIDAPTEVWRFFGEHARATS